MSENSPNTQPGTESQQPVIEGLRSSVDPEDVERSGGDSKAASELLTLEELHKVIERRLHIPSEDRDVIDVFLATYLFNRFKGDPLWLMLVDASGGGKTELLRSVKGRPDSYFMGRISPKSLNSGYRGKDSKGKDPSILPQLDGKVFVIKDLSPLLSMRSEDRRQVFGTLRDAFDGFTIEAKGSGSLRFVPTVPTTSPRWSGLWRIPFPRGICGKRSRPQFAAF